MDTSELRFGSVQNLVLELETRPRTEPFSSTYLQEGISGAWNWDLLCHCCLTVCGQADTLLTELCWLSFCYRPQTNFAKVMFLHVSVILSTRGSGGVPGQVHHLGRFTWGPLTSGGRSTYCWQAGGTHPTGMLSCFRYFTLHRPLVMVAPLKTRPKQECIPVGCVPSAAVAVCLGVRGCLSQCMLIHPPGQTPQHLPLGIGLETIPSKDRMTDSCKIITFANFVCGR